MKKNRQSSDDKKRYSLRRRMYGFRSMQRPVRPDICKEEGKSDPGTEPDNGSVLQELRDTVLRQRAEFENFRKRTQREKEMIRETAAETVLAKLLPIVDNLDRAVSSAGTTADIKSVKDGVVMIATQLRRTLESEGLRKIEALHQPFDPTQHDALASEERADVPENHVCEVLMPGYIYKDKLLRAAMVKVAKAPTEATGPE